MKTKSAGAVLISVFAFTFVSRAAAAAPLSSWQEFAVGPPPLAGSPSDVDSFGNAVAIFGNTAVIAERGRTVNGKPSGAVFAFTLQDGALVQPTLLMPPSLADDEGVGSAVAICKSYIALGSASGAPHAVWVLDRAQAVWRAVPPPAGASSNFGTAVVISETSLLVGDSVGNNYEGVVYPYERDGDAWKALAPLHPTGDDDSHDTSFAFFGYSLALDGDALAVGAYGEGDAGAAYVFRRDASRAWNLEQRLGAPDGSDAFGRAVAVANHEGWLAVGDRSANDDAGIVRVFSRSADWSLNASLKLDDAESYGWFGNAVAFGGGLLFVSAPDAIGNNVVSNGLIQSYAPDPTWPPKTQLIPSEASQGNRLGNTLAASATGVLVAGSIDQVYGYFPELGAACNDDSTCASGHCAEGVCCDAACSTECHSCLAVNTGMSGGVDGQCLPVDSGSDPIDDCSISMEVCGTTGACDGAGQCEYARKQVSCSKAICKSTTSSVGAGACDGKGTCVAPAAQPCKAGFSCRNGSCQGDVQVLATCSESDDCDESNDFYCLEGECVAGIHCSTDGLAAFDDTGRRTACDETVCRDGTCLSSCAAADDCQSGSCSIPEGICLPAHCAADGDCNQSRGFYCLEGECVSGFRCSADFTSSYDPQGVATACQTTICRAGQCLIGCQNTDDCAQSLGLVCRTSDHQCVAEAALEPSRNVSSCSFRGSRNGPAFWGWVAGALFGLTLRRRTWSPASITPANRGAYRL
jgi:hypothetical protein